MLFAQTGTAVSPPSKATQEEVNPAMVALWWIVPLVIAAIGIAFKVRANQVNEARRQASRKDDAAKTKSNARGVEAKAEPKSESSTSQFHEIEPNESTSARTPSQTKSKKEKNKGKSKNKPIATTQPIDSASQSVTDSLASSQPASLSASSLSVENAAATSASNATTSEPKPSNAIFEPLRDATKAKRRPAVEESSDEQDQRTESAARGNDAYNQLFGGKFERIIPKQTLRSTANRWPTPETPPTRVAPRVVESSAPSVSQMNDASTVQTTSPTTPAPAPAKGLKSFVSKVKSQPLGESESVQAKED